MKVLFITGSYPPMKCGVGDYLFNLANSLSKNDGINIGILTSIQARPVSETDNVMVYPIIRDWGISRIFEIVRFIKDWNPDIVHIQYPTQGYMSNAGFMRRVMTSILPLIAYLTRRKVVQTWHEGYKLKNAHLFLFQVIVPSSIVVVRPEYEKKLPALFRYILNYKRIMHIRNASSIRRKYLNEDEKSNLRRRYLKNQKRLIVFFGFIYPHKGVEYLFNIANPETDRIVIVGGYDENSEYIKNLKRIANSKTWRQKVEILGFASEEVISEILTVADAVVLPFRGEGGGEWNSSLHAAISHDSFVLTTSLNKYGYDKKYNVYYAKIDNVEQMRLGLDAYAGTKRKVGKTQAFDDWEEISEQHILLYRHVLDIKDS